MNKALIYGKDETEGIVSIDIENDSAIIYIQNKDGSIKTEKRPNEYWLLVDGEVEDSIPLNGNLHYKYAKKYSSESAFKADLGILKYQKGMDTFSVWNPKEAYMIKSGATYYKGLSPKNVSVLSFDIETTSLVPTKTSLVLLIAVTYRSETGAIERRLFCYDDYKSNKEMIYAFCHYVRDKNPSVLIGHNIFGFDLPYLRFYVKDLPLGRRGETADFATRPAEFRKDGSQTYTYTNVLVPGREVVDTMFLSYKYDAAARKYESYGIKAIISSEGLERAGRQHYDASQIRFKYTDRNEWAKIKEYAEHDADDALALWDLMIPSYFYFAQAVPKTLQQIINGASGAQINSWMVRAYIQEKHSIPAASDVKQYEGAISFGNPGVYKNVSKVDVASLYPSIILQENVYDKAKDPKKYFLEMVSYFTAERLLNKAKASETGDPHYKALEQAQKIFINSAYGFLGASGLNFNSPRLAAHITKSGREILQKGMAWANSKGFTVINGDTDSFCYTGSQNFQEEIKDLNSLFPDKIKWTDDGQYQSMVIVKAKNYAMMSQNGKIKIKGSALKATMKEPALTKFNEDVINKLLGGDYDGIRLSYERLAICIDSIRSISDVREWVSKKTVTKSVLSPGRTNESRILEAMQGKGYVEGDKIYTFFEDETTVKLLEDFNGKIDKKILYKKLYNTITVFESVLNLEEFPNFALKKNQARLNELLKGNPKDTGRPQSEGRQIQITNM